MPHRSREGDVKDCAVTYIGDILIFSQSWGTHLAQLQWVLEVLRQAGLTVNLKNSKLGQRVVQYLGFFIEQRKDLGRPDKVAPLWEVTLPSMKEDLQRFLGLTNYCW